eukprot:617609-Prorocentrum_lima.AAC.1
MDATIALRTATRATVQQVRKNKINNCYMHLPIELTVEPADVDVERIKTFLETTYSGNPAGRILDACMEALSLYHVQLPQKLIVMRGKGGDGKSARSFLRHNVFAGGAH